MLRILLVDDDTVNRVAISTMLDWEKLGFKIKATADNGKTALDMFKVGEFELIITDMRMPVMDGIEFIKEVRKKDKNICIVALSSYNDFELVREAFKNNVEDYILKGELNEEYLSKFILNVKDKIGESYENLCRLTDNYIEEYIMGLNGGENLNIASYYILAIRVNNYEEVYQRFRNEDGGILNNIKIILEQMSRIKENSYYFNITRETIGVCLCAQVISKDRMISILRQIIAVLKDYMNIDVTIGVSDLSFEINNMGCSIKVAVDRLSFRNIYGLSSIFIENSIGEVNLDELRQNKHFYSNILRSFKELNENDLGKYQREVFYDDKVDNIDIMKKKCLELIYYENEFLEEMGLSIWNIWGKRINFEDKLSRLEETNRVMIWLTNYNRFIMEYLKLKYKEDNILDMTYNAKLYIEDNYMNPNLDLAEVASTCSLNPYYFSTKFKKEAGLSFKEYLTKVRIVAAENLLRTTNMKLLDISAQVGYNNVEHFNRVFKKSNGVSPREYCKNLKQ